MINRIVKIHKKQIKKSNLRCKHTSYIIYKNKIISHGLNEKKTDTFAAKNGYKYPFKHSEMVALKKFLLYKIDPKKVILVNFRLINNQFAIAAPCKNCLSLIQKFGIKHIYFTISHKQFGSINL